MRRIALAAVCFAFGTACNAIVGLNGFHDVACGPCEEGGSSDGAFPDDAPVFDAPEDSSADAFEGAPPEAGADAAEGGSGFHPPEAGTSVDLRWPRWIMPNGGPSDSGLPNPASYEIVTSSEGGVIDAVTSLNWGNVTTGVTSIGAATSACALPWRLPTRIELVSILDTSGAADSGVLVNAAFSTMQPLRFWTSSSTPNGVSWTVDFGAGTVAPSPTASAVICIYVGGDAGGS
jgi:hypothetical protein